MVINSMGFAAINCFYDDVGYICENKGICTEKVWTNLIDFPLYHEINKAYRPNGHLLDILMHYNIDSPVRHSNAL